LLKRVEKSKIEPAGKKSRLRPFLHLEDLLAHYARTAPDRVAILAPGHGAVSYGALRLQVDEAVRALRNLGVGRQDRVAVVLPDGAETAVAIIAAATAAICLPLSPAFTADEWQRYFSDLRITALLTRADMDLPCRGIARSNGIPVIDISPQLNDGPFAFRLVGSGTSRPNGSGFSPGADDDAIMLLTSGTLSRPKLVPLTHASICRSAYNAVRCCSLDRATDC
jgi:acyl-CoA synthetase (AMP-forming)/AMP-acid ligase II